MDAMFLGKYRFYVPTVELWPGVITDGWASYEPSGGLDPLDRWCLWNTYNYVDDKKVGPYPPGKEINIAIFQRDDGQMFFQLNNGLWVQFVHDFPFVDTIDQASPFVFVGHEIDIVHPTPFNSQIQSIEGGVLCLADGGEFILSACEPQFLTTFTISQVTPPFIVLGDSPQADGLDFSWLDLSNRGFGPGSFVKADFSNCNLTGSQFLGCNFTNANLTNANLTGATLQHCTLDGALLNNCNLTHADLSSSTLFGTHLEGANLYATSVFKTQFAGAIFKGADLTNLAVVPGFEPPSFYKVPLAPPSATNPRTKLTGCRLNQSLIGNDWSMLDLTGATILDLSSPLSSKANPLKASYAVLTGLNKNNFVGLSLENAVFDYAVLDGLALNSSGSRLTDLSNASLIQASMHGTNLSGAILQGANMTGAQLGSLGQLFTLPTSFAADLNAGSSVDAALRSQFTQNGITLSATATLSILAPNRVWQLDDLGNNIAYTIRLEKTGDTTDILTVYIPAVSASLVDAYMPNAVLTGANLYGVLASRAQFYGPAARVDGFAVLEGAEFNDANLSGLSLIEAHLYGANLSGAQLFNAKFNGARLTPSANGVATNLSGANLQGADFTDAQLYGANMENAAVAIKVPIKPNPGQGGTYLFSLPYAKDTRSLAQYTAELSAAAKTLFSLNPSGDAATLQKYVTALQTNNLNVLKVPFIQHQITLSPTAQIKTIDADEGIWQIIDSPQSYTLWEDPDEDGNTELYASSSLPLTREALKQNGETLRWQTSVIADAPNQQWLVDNDSENPQNFSTGYVRFIMSVNDDVVDVYGSAIRITRLGDDQKLQVDTETCNVTTLAVTEMDGQTICPNGTELSINQQGEETWDEWLRAALPPKPPTCVPTDFNWCPPASTTKEEEK